MAVLSTLAAVASIAAGAAAVKKAIDAPKQAKKAARAAEAQAAQQNKILQDAITAQDKELNNTRSARTAQNREANIPRGQGISSTVLTGSQGVDPASLTLGKKSLLGG